MIIDASKAILLIVLQFRKSFSSVVVVQESQLNKNVAHNIIEFARKTCTVEVVYFFFP